MGAPGRQEGEGSTRRLRSSCQQQYVRGRRPREAAAQKDTVAAWGEATRSGSRHGVVLPLPRGAAGVTAVSGFAMNDTSRLNGNYVSQFCPSGGSTCFPTILASIAALGERVVYARGCSDAQTCAPADIAAAAAAASGAARVVLQLGLDQTLEAEQRDRANMTLPPQQQALWAAVSAAAAAAAAPLAVVLVHGGAVAVPEVKASPAGILDAFYPGTRGGEAIAGALFGVFSPGGKLPIDMYDASYEAVDFLDMNVAALGRTYRYYSGPGTPGSAPLWPFGYGLSYTTSTVSWASGSPPPPMTITPASGAFTLQLALRNSGGMDGDEVIQVYVLPTAASLVPPPPFTPTRFLVGFQRVSLAAGASVAVPLTLDAQSAFTLTRDALGSRGLVSGAFTLAISRGVSGDELTVPVTVAA